MNRFDTLLQIAIAAYLPFCIMSGNRNGTVMVMVMCALLFFKSLREILRITRIP
jgi:hypothetical protein